jgi:hypothetical protein
MIFSAQERLQHMVAETQRKQATSDRMGTVHEVKQDKGEQKIRVEIGVDPQGKPLIGPWMNTTDKRGATREQHQYKKGQNVRISGDDYRGATVTAWSEGDSFPQPDNAKDHGYGDSYQAGKFHQGKWMPEDKDEQQGQAGGTAGGGGGQPGAGGGQQQEEKNHRYETWIAKEDNKPPKHSGVSKSSEQGGSSGGGQQSQQGQQKDQKQGEKKEPEEAMMQSMDEKNGFTARIGKEVRVAAHPDGAKTRAGKTYYSAKKDDNAVMHTEKDLYNKAKKNFYYVADEGNPYVNKPWQIKKKEKEDEVPNDDQLGNKPKKQSGGK